MLNVIRNHVVCNNTTCMTLKFELHCGPVVHCGPSMQSFIAVQQWNSSGALRSGGALLSGGAFRWCVVARQRNFFSQTGLPLQIFQPIGLLVTSYSLSINNQSSHMSQGGCHFRGFESPFGFFLFFFIFLFFY